MDMKVCVLLGVACVVIGQSLGAPFSTCNGKGKDVCNCGTTVVMPPIPHKLPKINKSLYTNIKLLGPSYGSSKSHASVPFLHGKTVTLERPPIPAHYSAHPPSRRVYASEHPSYEQTPVYLQHHTPYGPQQRAYRSHPTPLLGVHPQADQGRNYRSNPESQPYALTQLDAQRAYLSHLEPEQYAQTQPEQERMYRSNIEPQHYSQTQSEQERMYRSNIEPQHYAQTEPEHERMYRSNLDPQYAETQSEQERMYRSNLDPHQYAQTQPEHERMYRSNLDPQYAETQSEQERMYRSNLDPQQYTETQSEQERTYRSNPEPQPYAPAETEQQSSSYPRDTVVRPYLSDHVINKRSENTEVSGEETPKSRIFKRSYPTNQASYGDSYKFPKADPVSIALALQLAKKLEKFIKEEQIHGFDTIPEDGSHYKYEKDVPEDGLQNYEDNVMELRKGMSSYGDLKKYAEEYDDHNRDTSLPERFHSLTDIGYEPINEQTPNNYETEYDAPNHQENYYDNRYPAVYQPYEQPNVDT